MDGFEMRSNNSSANRVERLPTGLSAVRMSDKLVVLVFLLAFIVCSVIYYLFPSYQEVWIFAVPFVAAGLAHMLFGKNYMIILIIAAALAVTWYFTYEEYGYVMYIMLYVCFGAAGVASMVDAIQRAIFYRVLTHIRYVNVREKSPLIDTLTAFVFSIPHDMDTRNITADLDVRARKFPWKDMFSTIGLSMMIGMFFWIYISFNPSFVNLSDSGTYTITGSSLLMFTVMLYVPLFVMPFSIFRSMNVRIGTGYRDFKLYNGVVSTMQRMAVPVAAALMFVLLAVSTSKDLVAVLVFIAISAVMILIIVMVTSIIYFRTMEAITVSSIARKWKIFMPVPLLMGLKDRDPQDDSFPGTPVRDENDVSNVSIRSRTARNH